MNKHGAICVISNETGERRTCAAADPGGNYDTLCGVSTQDDLFQAVDAAPGARIDCPDCANIWLTSRGFKRSDFNPKAFNR